jgi:pyridoxine 5-phosphate synthase
MEAKMHRFALDIDPIAYIRSLLDGIAPDPIQAIILAELGGAESIVCYLRDDLKTSNERDVALYRQVVKSHLNVRTNLTEENIRKLMRIKPDMLTFVAPGPLTGFEPASLNLDMYTSQLENHIAELRSNGITTSALIEPELAQVKLAGKLELDYVEMNASALAQINDLNSEVDFLENLRSLSMAAHKMGMGINVSGNINYGSICDLVKAEYLEDIIVSKAIFSKALAIGMEQAVRDLVALI